MIILNNLNPELEIKLDENAFMPVRAHKPVPAWTFYLQSMQTFPLVEV